MIIEESLFSTDIDNFVVHQAIVFDWYDGPRHGVCAMETPQCEFVFDLISERFNPKGMDDRLLRLRQLPFGSLQDVMSAVSALGSPTFSVWIPVWSFETEEERQSADRKIASILGTSRQSDVILRTQDLQSFLGIWKVPEVDSLADVDWFARFGI